MPTLTVCAVNWHSFAYLRFLDHALRTLADAPNFRWLICNTDPNNDNAEALERELNATVVYRNLDHLRGSVAHGTGMNAILDQISTPYALICDPDCAVLHPGWDTICMNELSQHADVVAIGAPYEKSFHSLRYDDFPTVFFALYKSDFLRQPGVDFRPDWASWHGLLRKRARRIAGFFSTDRDTGWRLRCMAHAQQQRGLCFACDTQTPSRENVLTHGERGTVYYWDGQPIVTHQGRSNSREPFKDEISVRWFAAVCRFLKWNPREVDSRLGLNANLSAAD